RRESDQREDGLPRAAFHPEKANRLKYSAESDGAAIVMTSILVVHVNEHCPATFSTGSRSRLPLHGLDTGARMDATGLFRDGSRSPLHTAARER
ncbi:MAG: hypothetical protein ACODAD_16570, partial [Planctomycetota bacterium]